MHPPGSAFPSRQASRVVAIIPARYQSSRLPGKPLLEIGGRPMIEHVYRRAAEAPSVASVIVATDDERVARAVERFGGIARMTSPSHPSGTDRLAEVAAGIDCDLVVNVQGDEPLLDPRMIEEAVAPLRADPRVEMGTLRRAIDDLRDYLDPNVVKVVVDDEDFALYFSRAPIPFARSAQDPAGACAWKPGGPVRAYRHIGLYAYRRAFLLAFARLSPSALEQAEALEQLRALAHGVRVKAVETRCESIGVDTLADLERVRKEYRIRCP